MSFNWDKNVRPELTLAHCNALIELIEVCEPDVDPLVLEVKARYKKQILLEDAGLLKGSGIKKERPPTKNSLAGLEFDRIAQDARGAQTTQSTKELPVDTNAVNLNAGFNEPMYAPKEKNPRPGESINDFMQRTGFWDGIAKIEEQNKVKKEAGETLQDQFIDPRFQIKD